METFIQQFSSTLDIRRERNKDAEYMNIVKKMHLETQMRLRENPSERRKKFAEVVWEWCKEQNEILKKKYNSKN